MTKHVSLSLEHLVFIGCIAAGESLCALGAGLEPIRDNANSGNALMAPLSPETALLHHYVAFTTFALGKGLWAGGLAGLVVLAVNAIVEWRRRVPKENPDR